MMHKERECVINPNYLLKKHKYKTKFTFLKHASNPIGDVNQVIIFMLDRGFSQ